MGRIAGYAPFLASATAPVPPKIPAFGALPSHSCSRGNGTKILLNSGLLILGNRLKCGQHKVSYSWRVCRTINGLTAHPSKSSGLFVKAFFNPRKIN